MYSLEREYLIEAIENLINNEIEILEAIKLTNQRIDRLEEKVLVLQKLHYAKVLGDEFT